MIFPKIFWCYCILIFQVMCRDPPTVKIKDQGTVMGMLMKMYRTQRIVAYLGIPYALPPTGMLRFSPPIVDNLPSWDGVRNGSIAQPNCYQNTKTPKQKHTMVLNKLLNKVMDMDSMMMEMSSDQYDEDCLYLNLFVPDGESSRLSSIYFRPNNAFHSTLPPNVCLVLDFLSFSLVPISTQIFHPLNSLPGSFFTCRKKLCAQELRGWSSNKHFWLRSEPFSVVHTTGWRALQTDTARERKRKTGKFPGKSRKRRKVQNVFT